MSTEGIVSGTMGLSFLSPIKFSIEIYVYFDYDGEVMDTGWFQKFVPRMPDDSIHRTV